jgi:hypothetical protein
MTCQICGGSGWLRQGQDWSPQRVTKRPRKSVQCDCRKLRGKPFVSRHPQIVDELEAMQVLDIYRSTELTASQLASLHNNRRLGGKKFRSFHHKGFLYVVRVE